MVIIVQYFYLDQLWRIFRSNRDIERAADAATDWILDRGYTNVILDVANENDFCGRAAWDACGEGGVALCCKQHKFTLLHWPPHGNHHVLLQRIRSRAHARGKTLPISASYCGGHTPHSDDLPHVDFINVHGNNLWQPQYACRQGHAGCAMLGMLIDIVRNLRTFKSHPKPVLVSEDDGRCAHDGVSTWPKAKAAMHDKTRFGWDRTGPPCFFHFDECSPSRNSACALGQAVDARVSWGLYIACCSYSVCPYTSWDYSHGFQCPPTNWNASSTRQKQAFFTLLKQITGGLPAPTGESPPPPRAPPLPLPSPSLLSPPPPSTSYYPPPLIQPPVTLQPERSPPERSPPDRSPPETSPPERSPPEHSPIPASQQHEQTSASLLPRASQTSTAVATDITSAADMPLAAQTPSTAVYEGTHEDGPQLVFGVAVPELVFGVTPLHAIGALLLTTGLACLCVLGVCCSLSRSLSRTRGGDLASAHKYPSSTRTSNGGDAGQEDEDEDEQQGEEKKARRARAGTKKEKAKLRAGKKGRRELVPTEEPVHDME